MDPLDLNSTINLLKIDYPDFSEEELNHLGALIVAKTKVWEPKRKRSSNYPGDIWKENDFKKLKVNHPSSSSLEDTMSLVPERKPPMDVNRKRNSYCLSKFQDQEVTNTPPKSKKISVEQTPKKSVTNQEPKTDDPIILTPRLNNESPFETIKKKKKYCSVYNENETEKSKKSLLKVRFRLPNESSKPSEMYFCNQSWRETNTSLKCEEKSLVRYVYPFAKLKMGKNDKEFEYGRSDDYFENDYKPYSETISKMENASTDVQQLKKEVEDICSIISQLSLKPEASR